MSFLRTEGLTYVYGEGTPFKKQAITNVSIDIDKNMLYALIGHTGSGKSTLVQHLNGLIKPNSGKVIIDGVDIWLEPKKIRDVRFKVGLVFQYPEYQLFDETVEKDIAFGPKNLGLNDSEISERVKWAAEVVGLKSSLLSKSPFDLSGGEKRRAAIAGVLAMKPEVLILDEPCHGLDEDYRMKILDLLETVGETGTTTLLHVTHDPTEVLDCEKNVLELFPGQTPMYGISKR